MVVRARWAAVAAALLLSSCQTQFVGGWMPWWQSSADRAQELSTIAAAAPLMNEVSPFWYAAQGNGTINPLGNTQTLADTVASLRASGLKVLPSIVDGNGKGVMAAILADPTQRTNHVQQIVNLAVGNGYDGVDLDYEVFAFTDGRASWPATQPNWVAFVTELGAALHAQGKLLSVTVPPVWNGGAAGYTVYAQAAIAPSVDRLRLMVYDWSVSTAGPIAPLFWVDSVMAYSSTVVPASKLQLGVPAYGRHWTVQKNKNELCPDGALFRDSITMEEAPRLAASKGLAPVRSRSVGQVPPDQVWGEMTFNWEQTVSGPRTAPPAPVYTPPADRVGTVSGTGDPGLAPAVRLTPPSTFVTCTVSHIVYYPDAYAVRERAVRAVNAGWEGIYIWALGYETADVWPVISDIP